MPLIVLGGRLHLVIPHLLTTLTHFFADESAEFHRVCFFFILFFILFYFFICNTSPKASSTSPTLLFIVLEILYVLSMGLCNEYSYHYE